MTEEPRAEITFKYFDERDAELHFYASDMASLLWELDQRLRAALKYEENGEKMDKFCEELRQMIREGIDLDRVYR